MMWWCWCWWWWWWCKETTSNKDVHRKHSQSAKIFSHIDENTTFPHSIPYYPVRRDVRNVLVSRGDVEKKLSIDPGVIDFAMDFELKNHHKMKKRVSFAQMQTAYQCASNKPDLDSSGVVSLMRMAPPSMTTVEWACAYAETRSSDHQTLLGEMDRFRKQIVPGYFRCVWF